MPLLSLDSLSKHLDLCVWPTLTLLISARRTEWRQPPRRLRGLLELQDSVVTGLRGQGEAAAEAELLEWERPECKSTPATQTAAVTSGASLTTPSLSGHHICHLLGFCEAWVTGGNRALCTVGSQRACAPSPEGQASLCYQTQTPSLCVVPPMAPKYL